MSLSGNSFAHAIVKRPWLRGWMQPLANWYADLAGYRKLGLKADDLIREENDLVVEALKRLPPKEAYDRVFRLRRAFQCSLSHTLLPKEEHTKPEDDKPYLLPLIAEIEAEIKERADLDSIVVKKKSVH